MSYNLAGKRQEFNLILTKQPGNHLHIKKSALKSGYSRVTGSAQHACLWCYTCVHVSTGFRRVVTFLHLKNVYSIIPSQRFHHFQQCRCGKIYSFNETDWARKLGHRSELAKTSMAANYTLGR